MNWFKYILPLILVLLASCSTPRPHTSSNPYSFANAPFVNPKIIQDLSGWISDSGDQVVAINLLKSQKSNRYFGDVQVRTNAGFPYVFSETTTIENGHTNQTSFGYQFVGVSSGRYVLLTDWSGGSGIFKNLMLVKFENDRSIDVDLEGQIRKGERRLLIKKVGEIALGDRWDGELKLSGDSIQVGKDKGWFTISGGRGGNDQKDRVLKVGEAVRVAK